MKYIVTFSLSAALLGTAVVSSGCLLDACTIIAILVASCLPAWVVREYWNEPRSVMTPRLALVDRPVVRTKLARATRLAPKSAPSTGFVSTALER